LANWKRSSVLVYVRQGGSRRREAPHVDISCTRTIEKSYQAGEEELGVTATDTFHNLAVYRFRDKLALLKDDLCNNRGQLSANKKCGNQL